ncbi:hypothetical protein LX36DRAFT_309377 [Colletotrichum falcatum]|nr:hypothetical protein LX36DRAFT_309377 [Colletotrichum falcatum]
MLVAHAFGFLLLLLLRRASSWCCSPATHAMLCLYEYPYSVQIRLMYYALRTPKLVWHHACTKSCLGGYLGRCHSMPSQWLLIREKEKSFKEDSSEAGTMGPPEPEDDDRHSSHVKQKRKLPPTYLSNQSSRGPQSLGLWAHSAYLIQIILAAARPSLEPYRDRRGCRGARSPVL